MGMNLPTCGERFVRELLTSLENAGLTLGCAESCGGGLLGATITAVPGSSKVFKGTIAAYSNDVKTRLLGVPQSILEDHGAVSERTSWEMALGGLRALNCDICVSITGITSPPPANIPTTKATGLTFITVARSPDDYHTIRRVFEGDRNAVRKQAVEHALAEVILTLAGV